MSKLTGRRRFRAQKRFMRRELLVLQVECVVEGMDVNFNGYEAYSWRDATVEDLMTIAAVHKPFLLAN